MIAVGKKIIGLVEDVTILGSQGKTELKAKVDTGASRSSVDSKIAEKIGLDPTVSSVRVKSSMSKKVDRRPLAEAKIVLAGVEFNVSVSIADRTKMKYLVLVGLDVLKSGLFLIDPVKPRNL